VTDEFRHIELSDAAVTMEVGGAVMKVAVVPDSRADKLEQTIMTGGLVPEFVG